MGIRDDAENLIRAVASLQNEAECEAFFTDLCSTNELVSISKRIQIAKLIHEGKTYREKIEETHSANVTISRVKIAMEKEGSILIEVLERMRQKY